MGSNFEDRLFCPSLKFDPLGYGWIQFDLYQKKRKVNRQAVKSTGPSVNQKYMTKKNKL